MKNLDKKNKLKHVEIIIEIKNKEIYNMYIYI